MKLFNIFISLICTAIFSQAFAQSVAISGKVTSNRFPMKQVQITFIDNSDTTKKFSAVTDNLGKYEIDVTVTSLGRSGTSVTDFELSQNYPNPFASSTSIQYQLKNPVQARLAIYDILGRKVRAFSLGMQNSGQYNIVWDGTNRFGEKVAPGIYFYRLQANQKSLVRKMIVKSTSDDFMISSPQFMAKKDFAVKGQSLAVQSSDFTIRLQNGEDTFPVIQEQQYENVQLKNDTTINFSIDHYASAQVDFEDEKQIIRGFGAATPWYLPVATDSEMETAFGMDEGQLGFTIFRLTIDPDSNGWAQWIPSAKKAHEMGAKIIASAWHAPEQMREQLTDYYRVRHDKYGDYAEHLNAYAAFMADNGAPLYGLSVQNEPEAESWTHWTPDEMLTFMRENAHAIEGTRVMAPESWSFKPSYTNRILNDSVATANTDIICGHIYGGGLFPYPLAMEKGKEVWMTEYLMGDFNSGHNLHWAMEVAENINDVFLADMNVYVWWTMVRYYGPIGDGKTAAEPDPREIYPEKGEVTKKGYVMSQFSRFIRPGDVRVASWKFPIAQDVLISAYKDSLSAKKVIVVINKSEDPGEIYLSLKNSFVENLTPYITSADKNVLQGDDIAVSDNRIFLDLEPQSITTFVSDEL